MSQQMNHSLELIHSKQQNDLNQPNYKWFIQVFINKLGNHSTNRFIQKHWFVWEQRSEFLYKLQFNGLFTQPATIRK